MKHSAKRTILSVLICLLALLQCLSACKNGEDPGTKADATPAAGKTTEAAPAQTPSGSASAGSSQGSGSEASSDARSLKINGVRLRGHSPLLQSVQYKASVSNPASLSASAYAEGTALFTAAVSGTETKGLVIELTGTPEQSMQISWQLGKFADLAIPAGTYTDYTDPDKEANFQKTFTTDGYAPLRWDFRLKASGGEFSLRELAAESDELLFDYVSEELCAAAAQKLAQIAPELQDVAFVRNADGSITLTARVEKGTELNLQAGAAWNWVKPADGSELEKCDRLLSYLVTGNQLETAAGATDMASLAVSVGAELICEISPEG